MHEAWAVNKALKNKNNMPIMLAYKMLKISLDVVPLLNEFTDTQNRFLGEGGRKSLN